MTTLFVFSLITFDNLMAAERAQRQIFGPQFISRVHLRPCMKERLTLSLKESALVANRAWHLTFGFLIYIVFTVVWNLHFGWNKNNLVWMTLGIMSALWGADLPDYDLQMMWFEHRDIRTHSALITVVFFVVTYFLTPSDVYLFIAPALGLFFIGNASHFFLDEFPVWAGSGDPRKPGGLKKGGTLASARWFIEGITGGEIYKKLEGTYLIHLPMKIPEAERKETKGGKVEISIHQRKTLNKNATRTWLFANALINVVLALMSLNAVAHWWAF